MNKIGIASAVRRIRLECAHDESAGSWHTPFFFIAGAGVSTPQVPLATEIEEECRSRAHNEGVIDPPSEETPLARYSHWFASAFPGPAQRREYLRSKIHDKALSEANLRLAYILISRKIATIAVTTNFDDFLSRALTLFGERPIICDHPDTSVRIDVDNPELQIAHVHGTYRFYDSCNLASEVQERSGADGAKRQTGMGSMLDNLLRQRAPIILGYSGWSGDVVMTALERRLAMGRLPQNLYWFCYRASEPDELNERAPWLANHPNVFFVVPQPGGGATTAAQTLRDEYLPAQEVLGRLIRELDVPPPSLFQDPLDFFAAQLERAMETTKLPDSEGIYNVQRRIEEVRQARDLYRSAQEQSNGHAVSSRLQLIRDALWRSDSAAALAEAVLLDIGNVPTRFLWDVVHVINAAIDASTEHAQADVAACGILIAALKRLGNEEVAPPEVQDQLAMAHVRLARIHAADGAHKVAIETYDRALAHLLCATGSGVREFKIEALVGKAMSYLHFCRFADALSSVEVVLHRYVTADETIMQRGIASALLLKATIHQAMKQPDAAISAYGAFLTTFRSAYDEIVRQMYLAAAASQGELLAQSGRTEEARNALKIVTKSLSFPNVRQLTLFRSAAVIQGICETILGDLAAAHETIADAIARSADPTSVTELLAARVRAIKDPASARPLARLLELARDRAARIAAAVPMQEHSGLATGLDAAPN